MERKKEKNVQFTQKSARGGVTREEIAKRAGVSISVVSRALNNSGYVKEEKRRKILEIAEELGYRQNPAAMSLMTQRTKQILFYCKDLENAYNIEMYEGMIEAAEKQGYVVLFNGRVNYQNIKNMLVDGVILPTEIIALDYLKGAGKNYCLPAVVASYGNLMSFPRAIPAVECDLWEGMEKVLDYLWNRGHRKIALVTPYDSESANSRNVSWRDFMECRFGKGFWKYFFGICGKEIQSDERLLELPEEKRRGDITVQESFFEKGELAAEFFYERRSDATAVVCFNDEMALGFYKRIRSLGYEIPKDISLVGIDGAYSRRYADQSITTLVGSPRLHGGKCVEVLLDYINGKKIKYKTIVSPRLLEGETVRSIR